MNASIGYYIPSTPTPEQVEQNRTRVVPTGNREWTVINDGETIATVMKRDTADLIAAGLRALRTQGNLYERIFALEDCIADMVNRRQA